MEIKNASSLQLLGVGVSLTTGVVETKIHFETQRTGIFESKDIILYVVPRLNTKVIIGNDHLVPWKAQVNLNNNTLRFSGQDSMISISSEQLAQRVKAMVLHEPGKPSR